MDGMVGAGMVVYMDCHMDTHMIHTMMEDGRNFTFQTPRREGFNDSNQFQSTII
jgi:hypothetical protein